MKMYYRGHAIFANNPDKRVSGLLVVSETSVVFEGDNQKAVLPLTGIKISRFSDSDSTLFFAHPDFPEVSFLTDHEKILGDSHFKKRGGVKVYTIRQKRHHLSLSALAAGLGLLVLFGTGIFLHYAQPLVSLATNQISFDSEKKIGDALFGKNISESSLLQNEDVVNDLVAMTKGLRKVAESEGFSFVLHVVTGTNKAAYALPGGHIIITVPLLLAFDSPEALLGIVAHEMAHVSKHHILKHTISSLNTALLMRVLAGNAQSIVASLGDNAPVLDLALFSHDQETDANKTAWEYLVKAHIDPHCLIDGLKKLDEGTVGSDSELAKQIKQLEKKAQEFQPEVDYAKIKLDFQKLKSKVSRAANLAFSQTSLQKFQ